MILPRFQTGHLPLPDAAARPYVTLGTGPRTMVVVPGAADGLRTCVDVAIYLAWHYRHRVQRCRILILSRREPLLPPLGIERHAREMAATVDELGWGPAVWECHSAAGPVGQQVAVLRPDLVQGLVLSSTYDYVSDRTKRVLGQWQRLAEHPDGADAFLQILEQKYRPPAEVLAELPAESLPPATSRRDQRRLAQILDELMDLDQRGLTPRIGCPTLVLGGANDRTVPPQVQREMASRIPTAAVEISDGYGHYHDMENPDYEGRIARFVEQAAGNAANSPAAAPA